MQEALIMPAKAWSLLQKICFRIFFIYFLLLIQPWSWIDPVPGAHYILDPWFNFSDRMVQFANRHFFHVFGIKEVYPVFNGSGDTSFHWAELYTHIALAIIGAAVWSTIDFRKKNYRSLNYILCLLVRYHLIITAFIYGILKVFCLQMPFPSIGELATPLGDLLPMRFSWFFIGYSTPYEIFSGLMEILAASLLFFRRTATMGALIATAVFINVMMLNLCYDIPVKLQSMNLVLLCFYLIINEADRIACFFVFNKPAAECSLYNRVYPKKWMRITRIVLKVAVVLQISYMFIDSYSRYKDESLAKIKPPFKDNIYTVQTFAVNGDTLPPLITDTLRWQDMIIDKGGRGSIQSKDTTFRKRYGRGIFTYEIDSITSILNFKKRSTDSIPFAHFRYSFLNDSMLTLTGKKNTDSLFVLLRKSNRHFQLAEKQFHWLSEANR